MIKKKPVLCPHSGEKGHPAIQLRIRAHSARKEAFLALCDWCDGTELWPTRSRPKPES